MNELIGRSKSCRRALTVDLPLFRTSRRAGAAVVFLLALFLLSLAPNLQADSLSGTVKDPSGAIIVGARIEISSPTLAQPLVFTSDNSGRFTAPDLKSGKYELRVTKDGFEVLTITVDLSGTADLPLNLVVAAQETSVTVTGKSSGFGNSDSKYRQLRDIGLGESFRCENFRLQMDVGNFEFKSGTMTILAPIDKFETGAVFVGQGHFSLKPFDSLNTRELVRRSGSPEVEEDFTEIVLRFSPGEYPQLGAGLGPSVPTPSEAAAAFQRWKEKIRHRHEIPESFTQAMFEGESIDNVDADILAAVYNPAQHPAFFNAYMRGTPHHDLRFFMRIRVGALSQMESPEEVALINYNGGELDDGVWYSAHLMAEYKARTASGLEDKRLFATKRYVIETVIGKNEHLHSVATITFEPLVPGERVLKFSLLPDLRVTRVSDQGGQDLHFIQEDKKQDGSFYAVLDAAPAMGQEHSITVEYTGDKILTAAGNGSFYVQARESWYPNLNGFGEKALYDLTFKVPHPNLVISVGNLQGQSQEAGFSVSHWVTTVPVAVAGFNYGQYKKVDLPDTITHYNLTGYYLTDLPDSLRQYGDKAFLNNMAPGAMTKYALEQTRAQMQVCTMFFGKGPYENLQITEQPNFNFGQSWPGLVYLPISAYIDSTQRWLMFGQIDTKFTGFVQEVTPHEVAHQWFGHGVTWATYHDIWLSEGFAEFAAGLFLQQGVGGKWQKDYLDFWERQRVRLLEKNSFGTSPNDAGPIWMGLRLNSPRTPQAYQGVTYSKGAYVLLMLRSIMYADQVPPEQHDAAFIAMMHDYMATYHDSPASTEAFKAIVEKHMTKQLDLQQNGRLDWFFNEWVYGTQIPRYAFKYEIEPADGGKVKVHAEITQSEVDDHFAMFVPVFADFGSGMLRLGQVAIAGNSTRQVNFILDARPKKVALNYYKDVLER
jgi:Peptidase family M1 domain/Carboxypeptidase regulatory-like domain